MYIVAIKEDNNPANDLYVCIEIKEDSVPENDNRHPNKQT